VDAPPYDVAWSTAQVLDSPDAPTSAAPLGQVAFPTGVRSAVTLAALPVERGPDADPVGTATVTVRALGTDGRELGSTETELEAGTPVRLDLAELGDGEQPAAVSVDVVGGDALPVAWSADVVADDGTQAPGTLVAALTPTRPAAATDAVQVRRVDAGG
jgi:hypothetical protein